MNVRTSAKITRPVTSPASRWMTASQVGADTTGRAARSSPRTATRAGGLAGRWSAAGPGPTRAPCSAIGFLRCSPGPPARVPAGLGRSRAGRVVGGAGPAWGWS